MARLSAYVLGIAIDRRSDLPVGVQLTWALRSRILTGELAPGTRLPALHRLAEELGLNANTIRSAYVRLEHDGLVEIRHGSGTFVKERADSRARLARALAGAAQAADEAGVPARDVAAALYMSADPDVSADPAHRRRRELRAEIAVLERSLSELRARPASPQPGAGRPRRPSGPRLLSVEELEAQRDRVLQQLVDARAGSDPPQDDQGDGAPTTKAAPAKAKRSSSRGPRVSMRVAPDEG